jgi:predicted SAM-dependent methyltransferase
MKLLNLAAGKMPHLNDLFTMEHRPELFVVNVDTMYYDYETPDQIERDLDAWSTAIDREFTSVHYCKEDVFEFLERTKMEFDIITAYRFLEHVSFTQVLYFIYLVSTCIREGGIVDIIVPNYQVLADMLLNESVLNPEFEEHNILLTTELLNEPSCPHASIWTGQRAEHFWEMEGRFKVLTDKMDPHFVYDGRNIYLRFQAERV